MARYECLYKTCTCLILMHNYMYLTHNQLYCNQMPAKYFHNNRLAETHDPQDYSPTRKTSPYECPSPA